MKSTLIISIVAILIAAVSFTISLPSSSLKSSHAEDLQFNNVEPYFYTPEQQTLDAINNKFDELNHAWRQETLTDNRREYLANDIKDELSLLQEQLGESSNENEKIAAGILTDSELMTFYTKTIFSIIFSIFAIYVILSRRFSEGTEKLAVSLLTMIAGVWIGSIS